MINNQGMEKKMEKQLYAVQKIAKVLTNGHFTIFSFTTNFRGMYGTPSSLRSNDLTAMSEHTTLESLLTDMAENPKKYVFPKGLPEYKL